MEYNLKKIEKSKTKMIILDKVFYSISYLISIYCVTSTLIYFGLLNDNYYFLNPLLSIFFSTIIIISLKNIQDYTKLYIFEDEKKFIFVKDFNKKGLI